MTKTNVLTYFENKIKNDTNPTLKGNKTQPFLFVDINFNTSTSYEHSIGVVDYNNNIHTNGLVDIKLTDGTYAIGDLIICNEKGMGVLAGESDILNCIMKKYLIARIIGESEINGIKLAKCII